MLTILILASSLLSFSTDGLTSGAVATARPLAEPCATIQEAADIETKCTAFVLRRDGTFVAKSWAFGPSDDERRIRLDVQATRMFLRWPEYVWIEAQSNTRTELK